MKPLIFIDGDQGTTGLQIASRLQDRHDLKLLTLPPTRRKDPAARREALNECDIALLCLPDDAAREAAAWVSRPRVRIIDASSAHRTTPGWTYGFPEMQRAQADRIREAARVSNPGCYPTGAIALLGPLVSAGLVQADHALSIHAVSGYSGRGRAGVEAYEGAGAAPQPPFQLYGLGLKHKHVPEIQQHAGLSHRPLFLPAYGAFRQGIVLTIPLHLRQLPAGVQPRHLRDALAAHYAGQPHVEVLSEEATQQLDSLEPEALNGTNRLRLAVLGAPDAQHAVLCAVFDNLGKGASGAAVQNLTLMLESRSPR